MKCYSCFIVTPLFLLVLLSASSISFGFQSLSFISRTASSNGRLAFPSSPSSAIRLSSTVSDADNNSSEDSLLPSPVLSNTIIGPRRSFLLSLPALTTASVFLLATPNAALAGQGLVQFPLDDDAPLKNVYHFMNAGTSLFDEQDIWSTNPLFLTNREDALSPAGQDQVRASALLLKKSAFSAPTIVTHSLAAASIDSANIVARMLLMGRDRIIPEYTFLDPRAIGKWDMTSRTSTEPAVWAMDHDEAGPDGTGGLPPPNTDGTPHETLADQAVRLRQWLSLWEGKTSGETILIIFPDGTGPALLSAMMAGIPYSRTHELEYASGELRLDVTKESTLELWKAKQQNQNFEKYLAVLQQGRKSLANLRSMSPDSIVSIRDEQIEAERVVIENEYLAKQEQRKRLQDEKENASRLERQRLIAEQQQAQHQQQRALEQQKRENTNSAANNTTNNARIVGSSGNAKNIGAVSQALVGLGVLAAGGLVVGSAAAPSKQQKVVVSGDRSMRTTAEDGGSAITNSRTSEQVDSIDSIDSDRDTQLVSVSVVEESKVDADKSTPSAAAGGGGVIGGLYDKSRMSTRVNGDSKSVFDTTTTNKESQVVVNDPYLAAEQAMQEYMDRDDGAQDWLLTLSEMVQEEEGEEEESPSPPPPPPTSSSSSSSSNGESSFD